jgi:hypothetical protein
MVMSDNKLLIITFILGIVLTFCVNKSITIFDILFSWGILFMLSRFILEHLRKRKVQVKQNCGKNIKGE